MPDQENGAQAGGTEISIPLPLINLVGSLQIRVALMEANVIALSQENQALKASLAKPKAKPAAKV